MDDAVAGERAVSAEVACVYELARASNDGQIEVDEMTVLRGIAIYPVRCVTGTARRLAPNHVYPVQAKALVTQDRITIVAAVAQRVTRRGLCGEVGGFVAVYQKKRKGRTVRTVRAAAAELARVWVVVAILAADGGLAAQRRE